MALSCRHYTAIAGIVNEVGAIGANNTWIAARLADNFAAENTRFDVDRFMRACGVTVTSEWTADTR